MAMSGKDDLTPREQEVLELLLARKTNEEMAEHFVVSVRTIETHVSHVLRKLGYKDRHELWRDAP
jgi:DNA-binding NarL/FixJ family response regulator